MNRRGILLIFPKLGSYDHIIKDMPLSLIYAARIAQREGFAVTIVDQRLTDNWQKIISDELKKKPVLAGISVMTGRPIGYALEISEFIKEHSSIPVVWGGVHPTILPEQTLANNNIDIVVRGDGEISLWELAKLACEKDSSLSLIKGISFKEGNRIKHNESRLMTDTSDMPLPDYDLVNFGDYTRFGSPERFFSVLTSSGCPHRCGFCYSVSFDKNKWQPEPVERTIEHLGLIMGKYRPTYFSIIDSDFFVSLDRAMRLFRDIDKKGWKVKFGFRGVRVDDLFRADNDLFSLMEKVGVKHLHIGAESGSQRMLDLMNKDIKIEQTIEINRRLKRFPGIIPTYNFFSGIPTETRKDIKCSTELILRLTKDNPNCLITAYNQFTPYPGTALFDLAVKYGLKPPETLEGWIDFDQSGFARNSPWLTKKQRDLLDMLYVTTIFIDRKVQSLFISKKIRYKIFRLIALLYRPIARFRLKNHFTAFFLEKKLKESINGS